MITNIQIDVRTGYSGDYVSHYRELKSAKEEENTERCSKVDGIDFTFSVNFTACACYFLSPDVRWLLLMRLCACYDAGAALTVMSCGDEKWCSCMLPPLNRETAVSVKTTTTASATTTAANPVLTAITAATALVCNHHCHHPHKENESGLTEGHSVQDMTSPLSGAAAFMTILDWECGSQEHHDIHPPLFKHPQRLLHRNGISKAGTPR